MALIRNKPCRTDRNEKGKHRRDPSILGLVLLIAVSASGAVAQNKQLDRAAGDAYTVSMTKPHTHLAGGGDSRSLASQATELNTNLVMPVWTPGLNSCGICAPCPGFRRWWMRPVRLCHGPRSTRTPGASPRLARTIGALTHRVYANELSVRTSELNLEACILE